MRQLHCLLGLLASPTITQAFHTPTLIFPSFSSTTTKNGNNNNNVQGVRNTMKNWQLSSSSSSNSHVGDPTEAFSEERKKTLFQFLLRDLQIEGVPLLECDADQTHILQAAMWTTMAELSDKDEMNKACMIFENIPIDSLREFVDDFNKMKTEKRLFEDLPELKRFNVTLVGKGIGPAILVAASEKNEKEKEQYSYMTETTLVPDESKWTAAMKTFVARMMPSSSSQEVEQQQQQQQPSSLVGYRLSGSLDVCDTLAAFWNCVCELMTLPEDQLSSTVLCMPPPPDSMTDSDAVARFSAVSELISRSLSVYRGQDVFNLLHMHPNYERQSIYPNDRLGHGHLPPTGWLRAILKQNGKANEAETFTDDELELQDYQRKSPLPGVFIKRAARKGPGMSVEVDVGDKKVKIANGGAIYSDNVIRLATMGKEKLQSALEAEISIIR